MAKQQTISKIYKGLWSAMPDSMKVRPKPNPRVRVKVIPVKGRPHWEWRERKDAS